MSHNDEPLRVSPIAELFRTDRVALWATTYNLDLDLFNSYLLGRLGEPPLNVVVIADRDRLDATFDSLPPERITSLGPVNRRWLLRGARLGTGRFHPKSYLTVTGQSVTLLVGSGNLSINGLDAGREVFTVFAAGTPHGDAAIRTWMSWMRQIVRQSTTRCWPSGSATSRLASPRTDSVSVVGDSPLWHNLELPLADQFCQHVLSDAEQVDELIVTAPFCDETGEALGRLLTRLEPRRVTVYTAASTKVDGTKLAARLADADAEVSTFAYLPRHSPMPSCSARFRATAAGCSPAQPTCPMLHSAFPAGPRGTGNVGTGGVRRLVSRW